MDMWASLARGALLAPGCALLGVLSQKLKLPRITGYLVTGFLMGPHGLNIFHSSDVTQLWIVDHACLGVIVLAAGAELQWEQLAKIHKQVMLIILGISAVTWAMVFPATMLLAPFLTALQGFTMHQLAAVSSLCATLMVARSPASAIAVIQETGGKGTFCSLVMAVVVAKDVLVIVAFAINIEMARPFFSHDVVDWVKLMEPMASVLFSAMLGVGGSVMVSLILSLLQSVKGRPWISHVRTASLFLAATLIFQTAIYIEAEPLLACAVSGLLAVNRTTEREGEDLNSSLETLMEFVNLPFFSLAGAALEVEALADALWLGCILFGVRACAVYCGSFLGCWLSNTPPEHRKRMWQTMITQAGVSLGLARVVARVFPGWGSHFQTLMVSIIILNLVSGPPLCRNAVISAGESRVYSKDHNQSSPDNSPRLNDQGV